MEKPIISCPWIPNVKLCGKDEKEINSLVQAVRIFSNDVGLSFGINKCSVLAMKRARMVKSVG